MPTTHVNRWSIDIEDAAKLSPNRRRRIVEIHYLADAGTVFVCSALYQVEGAKLYELRFALACSANDRAKIRSQVDVIERAIAEKLWEDAPENPKNNPSSKWDPFGFGDDWPFDDLEDLGEMFGIPNARGRAREVWERVRARAAAGGVGAKKPSGYDGGAGYRPPPRTANGFHISDDDLGTLGLARGASWSEVSKAFRAKAKNAHPDVGGDPAQMVALNQVYQRLREAMGR